MISFQHVVKEEEANKRIDRLLVTMHPAESRTQLQRWITKKYITVNGQEVKANYKCQPGDEISGVIPKVKQMQILPEDIPLTIVYEDKDLLVVNKPKGMVVHPTANHQSGTLVHALLHHCNDLSEIGGIERQGIVHRIDKDTSGLLVVAKKDNIHKALAKQFSNQEIERIYEAIIHGVIEHDSGLIDAPIGRDPKHRLRMAVVDQGKPSVTHFKVLARYAEYTHVKCQLETGRTHQIRVHMDYIGHPLVGDPKYTQNTLSNVDGQALFAKALGFIHPGKNEYFRFEIEQPIYFKNILTEIEKRS